MSVDLIALIASILIAWLVFTWLVRVLKASVKTALSIAVIIVILQFVFGIQTETVWKQISQIPQIIIDLFADR